MLKEEFEEKYKVQLELKAKNWGYPKLAVKDYSNKPITADSVDDFHVTVSLKGEINKTDLYYFHKNWIFHLPLLSKDFVDNFNGLNHNLPTEFIAFQTGSLKAIKVPSKFLKKLFHVNITKPIPAVTPAQPNLIAQTEKPNVTTKEQFETLVKEYQASNKNLILDNTQFQVFANWISGEIKAELSKTNFTDNLKSSEKLAMINGSTVLKNQDYEIIKTLLDYQTLLNNSKTEENIHNLMMPLIKSCIIQYALLLKNARNQ